MKIEQQRLSANEIREIKLPSLLLHPKQNILGRIALSNNVFGEVPYAVPLSDDRYGHVHWGPKTLSMSTIIAGAEQRDQAIVTTQIKEKNNG